MIFLPRNGRNRKGHGGPSADRVGLFDESFRISSDTEWAYRAESVGVRTVRVDRPFLVRRIHGDNLTYRTTEMRQAMERGLLKTARMRLARGSGP
jgi:hypothetical protein